MLVLLSGFLLYFISNSKLNSSLIPIIGIYLAAAYRLVPSISIIVQAIQEIQFNLRSVKHLYDDIKKFKINEIENNIHESTKINFEDKIEIKNLNFSYNNGNKKIKDILNNINLEIKKGDFIGIQGESGSGKSTFIDILIGLHKTNNGSILVDGKDIHNGVKSWQSLIGCVFPKKFLLWTVP